MPKISMPLMIVHGVNDSCVPISQAQLFREALEDTGYECGKGQISNTSNSEPRDTVPPTSIRTLTILDEFLKRRMGDE